MCYIFLISKKYFKKYFTGYGDHNTPFVVEDNITDVIKGPDEMGEDVLSWCLNIQMQLNTDKCHLLLNS